jgi:predicted secreted protein
LTVVVTTSADPTPVATATLTVATGGTATGTGYLAAPDAAVGAAALLGVPANIARLVDGEPADRVCTANYGGPDIADVTGNVDGVPVNARFHRSDGCGIADWDTFTALLGRPRWSGERRIYTRDETAISVPVGTQFLVELASDPTTGYTWMPVVSDGGQVRVVDETYLPPDTTPVGAGGYQQFTLDAVAAGAATVTFEYARPFEPSNPAIDTMTFTIDVIA